MMPCSVSTTYQECEDPRECEAGDLSTKFGKFEAPSVKGDFQDEQLTLYGFNRCRRVLHKYA